MLVHVSVIEKNICDNQKNKYEVLFPKRKIRKSNYNLEVVQRKLRKWLLYLQQVIATRADYIYSFIGRQDYVKPEIKTVNLEQHEGQWSEHSAQGHLAIKPSVSRILHPWIQSCIM